MGAISRKMHSVSLQWNIVPMKNGKELAALPKYLFCATTKIEKNLDTLKTVKFIVLLLYSKYT